jgi:GMP synthase (glutamine-hydrolysing)
LAVAAGAELILSQDQVNQHSTSQLLTARRLRHWCGEFFNTWRRIAISKALLIVHQEHSNPGRVGAILSELGYDIDRRCPNLGEPLPENLEEHDAVVIFGGPQSANDRENDEAPGIRVELDFIPKILETQTPYLGICLGAQILAKVLGANVEPHPDGCIEAGYYKVEPTVDGTEFLDRSMMFYQWHREGFELPSDTTLLAHGELFTNQAFQYGCNAYGIQFHPEVLEPIIRRWSDRGAERLKAPGAQPAEAHLDGFQKYDMDVDRWIRGFMSRVFDRVPLSVEVEAAD